MSTAITPDFLATLKEEEHHTQSSKRGDRRVKLERGKTWKIRFLPAQLGPRKTWYARISRHWVNFKPIVCPVSTHPDFGGDPDAYCPACEMSKVLNDSADEAVSKFGWNSRATDQWLTFCIVLDQDGEEVNGNELLNPWELWHYVNTWEELKGFFKGSYTKRNMLSVLDYKLGNVFSITKTAKGARLDKLDQCPIFDDTDPNFESYIERLEASIKMPKIIIPTQQQIEAFAAKMEEAAYKGDSGEKKGRRAPAVSDDPMEETDAEPAAAPPARRPSPAAAAPAARPAPAAARSAPASASRPAPASAGARPVPASAGARPAPATAGARPAPAAAPRPRPLPPEQAPQLDGDAEVPPEDDSNPELNPVPRDEAAPEEQQPEEQQVEEAPAAPPARSAVRPAARPPVAQAGRRLAPMPAAAEPVGTPDEGDEGEQLPEESTDQAPPAEVEEEEGAPEMPAPPPPPVARRGSAGPLGDAIKNRVAAIRGREGK